jgi:hypothetical protein
MRHNETGGSIRENIPPKTAEDPKPGPCDIRGLRPVAAEKGHGGGFYSQQNVTDRFSLRTGKDANEKEGQKNGI